MPKFHAGRVAVIMVSFWAGSLGSSAPSSAQELGERARQQILAVLIEKASRTPAQRKIATALLYASRESRGLVMVQGLPQQRRTTARARMGRDGMVTVRIRAEVTDKLLRTIAAVGGRVLAAFPDFGTVKARVPVSRLEEIAQLPEVRHIGTPLGFRLNATSEGDKAHAADVARQTYSLDGAGVKIGVLSDGVLSLADRQTAGELPPTCTDPPGSGACVKVVFATPECGNDYCDEGTAMMEIIHDLAPQAQLYFVGLHSYGVDDFTTPEEFAANILSLRNTYGCDILVDDVTFFEEGAFQDDVIARAVSTVMASGALYFSSAGNSGRKSAGTSGTWEGDYKNSNTSLNPVCPWPLPNDCWQYYGWAGQEIHTWNGQTGASAANSNELTGDALLRITLQWADPLGGATTDYDLFDFDSTLSEILEISADDQTAPGQDPFEWLSYGLAGERLVVVRWSGATKALRLDTFQGVLEHSTAGAIFGHNAAEAAVSVAAADAASTSGHGGVFTGGTDNPIETYSSDGPRRIFYNPNGTAVTPGNVLFATGGGRLLKKPDITAADCVTTAFPLGSVFNKFCGTSAAAPHAAAIAALLMSGPNNPSGGQASAAMFTTALDVTTGGTGWDGDAGVGIVMADAAMAKLAIVPAVDFYTVDPCRVFDTRLVDGPTLGNPIVCGLDYDFTMVGGGCGLPTSAKALSLNVTVVSPSAQGNVRLFAGNTPRPVVSAINYVPNVTRANNAVAPLSTDGKLAVRCEPQGSTHVIVDVNGYFK